MTYVEARELIEKKISDAKALIENTKNGNALALKTTLGYYDSRLVESASYDGRIDTSLIGDLEIRLPSRNEDDDPFISFGILCDLRRGEVKSEEALTEEIESFDEDIEKFIKALSNADNAEDFLTAESDKFNAEGERIFKEFEEKLAKQNKIMKIGMIALISLALVVLALKMLF